MPTAKDIMSTNVITVKTSTSIKDLAKIFIKNKINGVPVVDDDGKAIGMVTQGDLIDQNKNLHIPTVITLFDAVLFIESEKKFEAEAKKITGTKVEDIYNPDLTEVSPETDLKEIATIMAEKGIHTIPVVSGSSLIGVIGKLDLISAMI